MRTEDLFLAFIRRLMLAFLVIWLVIVAMAARGHAQNAGNVGIYTRQVQVFNAATLTTSSAIFPDFGFASQSLFVCTTGFSGLIDLEWSPTGTAPFFPLVVGSYSNDTSCSGVGGPGHILQLGGYWPNLRSTVTVGSGTVSAWYTASAAPIPAFPSAISSNGATSPVSCDVTVALSVANGVTSKLATGAQAAVNICSMTISLAGAPASGTVDIGWSTNSLSQCAATLTNNWILNTTASTPQTLIFPAPQNLRAPPGTSMNPQYACLTNNSGTTLEISYTYASLNVL